MLQQTETLEPDAQHEAAPEVVKSLRDHGALPQWRLMWRQFRKHKLALIGLIVLVPIYFIAVFSGFFAPAASDSAHTSLPYAPPQRVHISTEHGLFVYGYSSTRDQETFEQTFTVDKNKIVDVGLFRAQQVSHRCVGHCRLPVLAEYPVLQRWTGGRAPRSARRSCPIGPTSARAGGPVTRARQSR